MTVAANVPAAVRTSMLSRRAPRARNPTSASPTRRTTSGRRTTSDRRLASGLQGTPHPLGAVSDVTKTLMNNPTSWQRSATKIVTAATTPDASEPETPAGSVPLFKTFPRWTPRTRAEEHSERRLRVPIFARYANREPRGRAWLRRPSSTFLPQTGFQRSAPHRPGRLRRPRKVTALRVTTAKRTQSQSWPALVVSYAVHVL
jgi:hypothetical protein